MKAIEVKYTGGKYFTATDNDSNRAKHERDNALQFEDNYDAAARRLARKMHWHGTVQKGWLGDGRRVYVWLPLRGEDQITFTEDK